MWWDRLRALYKVEITDAVDKPGVLRAQHRLVRRIEEIMREAHFKSICVINLIHLLLVKPQSQRGNISLKVRHLPASNNRKHIRRLVHNIRQRNTRHQRILLLRNLLQHERDFLFLPRKCHGDEIVPPLPTLPLLFRLESSTAQGAPGRKRHTLGQAHGDDFALERAVGSGPASLIERELAQAVLARVAVCFDDEPGGGVAYAEVDYFAGGAEVVEGIHQFGNAGGVVPEVDVVLLVGLVGVRWWIEG